MVRITKDSILREHYDVIVVGAGLGGLTAASLLAKKGLSVLIVEQQDKPGGACTSFKREDRVYDVGAAMLYGFGEKGFRPFHFLLNQLEEPIDIIHHKTLARMTFEGREIVFWPDLQRFIEEMTELFPEDAQGLRLFYADLYKMYENIVIKNEVIVPPSEFSRRQALRSLMSDPFSILKMQKLLSTSTLELLQKYFNSPELLNFYDKLCSAYAYTTAKETPAVLAATMFIDNHVGGVYYPAGGAQMLPNTVEKAFERYGGQVLYRTLVDKVLIRQGTAYGVRLHDGDVILADRVIANATVWNIYEHLIDPENVSAKKLEQVRSLVPTFPSMTLYMVIDRKGIPENYYPWEIFIENRKVIDSSDLTLYINSLVDSTLCAPDELVVMAIAPNFCKWPAPGDPGYRSRAYEDQKQQEAQRMLDQIEAHIPGFRQHIRSMIIGTPTTIERYLLKNGGAVGGPKNQLGQEMLKRLHARSELKHLYFCGDSTVMGTGAPATVVSGVGAANVILRELHKSEYDVVTFEHQYIHFVEPPYSRPAYVPGARLSEKTAYLAARTCQGCRAPGCVRGCPAEIDIPGVLRRMEVRNYVGAAREIRVKNPFAETCALTCSADRLCQKDCRRRAFSDKPVNIAELERWVCEEAGEAGWPVSGQGTKHKEVAVLGDGPCALTCAYYLALSGYQVKTFAVGSGPAATLFSKFSANGELQDALQRDIGGILRSGIDFVGDQQPWQRSDPEHLLERFAAVFVATDRLPAKEGQEGKERSGRLSDLAINHPSLFLGDESSANGLTIVEAVARGRRAALRMEAFLG